MQSLFAFVMANHGEMSAETDCDDRTLVIEIRFKSRNLRIKRYVSKYEYTTMPIDKIEKSIIKSLESEIKAWDAI